MSSGLWLDGPSKAHVVLRRITEPDNGSRLQCRAWPARRGSLRLHAGVPGCTLRRAPPRGRASIIGWCSLRGDNSLPVFDNATAALRDRLVARGVSPDAIRRLSADGHIIAEDGVATASLDRTLRAVRNLHAAPGEACLFFATSHGTPGAGLYLAPVREFLGPPALDAALTDGCGKAPHRGHTVGLLLRQFCTGRDGPRQPNRSDRRPAPTGPRSGAAPAGISPSMIAACWKRSTFRPPGALSPRRPSDAWPPRRRAFT